MTKKKNIYTDRSKSKGRKVLSLRIESDLQWWLDDRENITKFINDLIRKDMNTTRILHPTQYESKERTWKALRLIEEKDKEKDEALEKLKKELNKKD